MSKQVLVVGCGSIGERHLRCLLRTGRAEVKASEINAALLERIKREYGVSGFATMDEALTSQKFDGVVICTPANTHLNLATKALGAGAGMLIEKPLDTNLDGVAKFTAEMARTGAFVGVGYIYHFHPAFVGAREALRSGRFGRPLQVSVIAGHHFPTYRPAYREIYFARHETGGGAIQDALTHLVNGVEWMVGPTTRLACEAKHQMLEGITVEDTVSVAARNGEVIASYALNQFQPPNEIAIHIHCEQGSVKLEVHDQRWAEFPRGATAWTYHAAPVAERDDLFVAQAGAFLDGLEGKANALCTIDEAAQTLKFNLAALQSARTGQVVALT